MANEAKILAIKADLVRRAHKKFPDDKRRQDRYIWGTIRRIEGKK